MRKWVLAAIVGPALIMGTTVAHGQSTQGTWKKYVVKELGFAFWAPGKVDTSVGTYQGAVAGSQQTQIFKSTVDNIEYVVTVISFQQGQEGADILGERTYSFQENKKVLVDQWARVETGTNQVFGRKLAVELPEDKGRTLGAFYFTKSKLFTLEATVLPANGDYRSSTPVRFVDSIQFNKPEEDAIEIEAPRFK